MKTSFKDCPIARWLGFRSKWWLCLLQKIGNLCQSLNPDVLPVVTGGCLYNTFCMFNVQHCGGFGLAQKGCISRVECFQLKTKYFHVAWYNAAHDQYLLNLSLETQIMNVLLYFLNWKYLRQIFVKITKNVRNVHMTEVRWPIECFNKSVQGFRVTCLFTGQYNTKGYDMVTDVI